MADLSVRLGSLELRNPVLSASGTYGHGLEMSHFTPPELVGALVSKTVTPRPRPGNPGPRICETEAGLINSIGLENRGLEQYVAEILPQMAAVDTVVITNIGGESPEEFEVRAAALDGEEAVDALEVNLSCPNVQGGRLPFATDPELAARVIAGVRAATGKPIFAKLSPNVARIGELAQACEAAGADGITAINTLLALGVNWRTRRPGVATVQGGYSGPAIKPVALRCAWECARSVSIPVLGCGGVSTAEDVLEFLVAGCTVVQIGTACFADPALPGRVAAELDELLEAEGLPSARHLIGTIHDGRDGRDGRHRESGAVARA
ncbi:MAG: dihydroorotate dehydrogenase [Planctomycetota bacterium]|nr:dihydroorotate dehydrogenase [Planctomycetota bacterium]